MGDNSKISWTNATWNPVTGCTKVSQGCKNCYAEAIAARMWSKQYPPNPDGTPRRFTDISMHPERLDQPLHWKKPRMIFVNSMSDLFHEKIPDMLIYRIFDVMARAYWHTFQVLTKRHARMNEFCQRLSLITPDELSHLTENGVTLAPDRPRTYQSTPLPNVWLGVSVENQKAADERIPLLLETPMAVRFLSCEPLLGQLELDPYLDGAWSNEDAYPSGPSLDWVIVGGESGPNARPMHLDWLRSIIEQCRDAGVPVFVKQDSGPRPGMQGRIPDELWIKEFPEG